MGRPLTKEQVIIDVWVSLSSETVGAIELGTIQNALVKQFGAGGTASPAAIARVLADHGARLVHPEVLDVDTAWRRRTQFGLFSEDELAFSTIDDALVSITKIASLHRDFEREGDETGAKAVRALVLRLKTELESARNPVEREIREWMAVWLQTPVIFDEWLSLRRKSLEFIRTFGEPSE